MKKTALVLVVAIAAALGASRTRAQSPIYSFEAIAPGGGPPGPDGFFGLGAAVAQDTIGVTHLQNSMRYAAGNGGFVGARTELVPAAFNNPPGVASVLFDMFVPTPIPAGLTFADIGVTVFGHDIDNGVFGVQSQFTDTVSITGLGPGQHNNLKIDLDSEFFSGQSFNDIFGSDTSDLDVASAFQFYMSKNGNVPVTVYIDNVRLLVPEPGAAALAGMAGLAIVAGRRRTG